MSRSVACDKADRAKMDVYVTSRNRAQPCLEWSKQTGRKTPIVGVSKAGSMLTVNAVDPEPVPVVRRVQGLNFGMTLSREQAQGVGRGDGLVATSGEGNFDALSNFNRSTICSIDMLRSNGRDGRSPSPLNSPGVSPRAGDKSDADATSPPHGRTPPALPGIGRGKHGEEDDVLDSSRPGKRGGHDPSDDLGGSGAEPGPHRRKKAPIIEEDDESEQQSPRRRRGKRLEHSYDAWNQVRPTSRSVNMDRMLGRDFLAPSVVKPKGGVAPADSSATPTGLNTFVTQSPTPAALPGKPLGGTATSLSSDSFVSSKHRRALGGDFSKTQGRNMRVKKAPPVYDINWDGIDRAPKAASFAASTSRESQKIDPDMWLAHDPVAPLCTRWKGVSVSSWYDTAYQAVKSTPPAVAAPRATTGTTSSVIKSATAQLNMIRSSLLRHMREGERKKKERLAKYALDPRMAERELSPMFSQTYNANSDMA